MSTLERFAVPGKWVLAGEHTVLRGGSALALPHPKFGLELEFVPGTELEILPESTSEVVMGLFEAMELTPPKGRLSLKSSIPVGAGLGSSAALCVAITRWMASRIGLHERDILRFATRLEDFFHGRSSGMDIAVIATAEPIEFSMAEGPRKLGIRNLPRFSFHDTGVRSRTHLCVEKVERLRAERPADGAEIDSRMNEACLIARSGLLAYESGRISQGLDALVESMHMSQSCFESWDLVPLEARRVMEGLKREGALATRLTGAGGGGMIVALWPDS